MRNRHDKKSHRAAQRALTPLRIEISQEVILADLHYPARVTRARRGNR